MYDLTVEDQPEFFANGVLVHNSLDACRYDLVSIFPRGYQEEKVVDPLAYPPGRGPNQIEARYA